MDQVVMMAAFEVGALAMSGGSLEDRLYIAMEAFHQHWWITELPKQFRGACEATLMSGVSDADKARVHAEYWAVVRLGVDLPGLRKLLMMGYDEISALPPLPVAEPIGLLSLWYGSSPAAKALVKEAAGLLQKREGARSP